MKSIVLIASFLVLSQGMRAQTVVGWTATTGDVSLSGAATAATIQQPATNGSAIAIDTVTVYCSVACSVSTKINGVAASATAGTVIPLSPAALNLVLPFNFYTASNASGGTTQGGIIHVPAGATVVLCFGTSCGQAQQFQLGPGGGTSSNVTVSIGSITGTANITFQGRSIQ